MLYLVLDAKKIPIDNALLVLNLRGGYHIWPLFYNRILMDGVI